MDGLTIFLALENVLMGLLIFGLCIPLLLGKVGMNNWYGMRVPKAFESDENWYAINRYGALLFMKWGLVIFGFGVIAFFMPFEAAGGKDAPLAVIFSFVPVIVIIPCIRLILYVRKV